MQAGALHWLLVVIFLGTPLANASAEYRTWDEGGDGIDWFDPNNWDPDGVPADEDMRLVYSGTPIASTDVRADSGGVILVASGALATFEANLYVADANTGTLNIMVGGTVTGTSGYIAHSAGSNGTAKVDGIGSTWTNSANLTVGNYGSGTLEVLAGGYVENASALIAYEEGSEGLVTVDGSGSTWKSNGDLNVGRDGSGTLEITGGGHVENGNGHIGRLAGSQGTVTVRDPCSTWTNGGELNVGYGGSGTLDIAGGGGVWNTYGRIGRDPDSNGAVTVDGSGSTWTNSLNLWVGGQGTGTLDITNGGAVLNTTGYVGRYGGSSGAVTVDGSGSTWTNSDSLYVGGFDFADATGTLDITNGGAVSNAWGCLGRVADSNGTVTVQGAGSTWTNSVGLMVGRAGGGTLSISGGGAVSNTEGWIGAYASSDGTVTVEGPGSTWTSTVGLYVGGSETAAGGTGRLTARDGGLVDAEGTLKLSAPGTLEIDGGQVTCQNYDNSAGGTLDFPGGTLTVDGGAFNPGTSSYTLEGAGTPTLRLTNGATADLDFGDLVVGGAAGAGWAAGLSYGVLDGAFNEMGENPGDQGIELGPMASEVTDLPAYTTHVYTGEFYDADGNVSFYENFDDSVKLIIDGREVMRHTPVGGVREWEIPHSTGNLALAPNSWHTFELRLGQGGGSSGPPAGMNRGFGFDNYPPICDANDEWEYPHPEDPGDASLFRTPVPNGALEVLAGSAVTTDHGYVGSVAGSSGTVTIDGNGPGGVASQWVGNYLFVGRSDTADGGSGRVTVSDGALLDVWDVKLWPGGSLSADGGGVRIGVGPEPTAGEVRVGLSGVLQLDGGRLTCGSLVNEGWFYWSSGTLAFSGELRIDSDTPFGADGGDAITGGRVLEAGSLFVGDSHTCTLNIAGGGRVSNNDGRIGVYGSSNGTVTVDGNGSTWMNSGFLRVGEHGSGTLNIAGGGFVRNRTGSIAWGWNSQGLVTVNGPGSLWESSERLEVGRDGNGSLTITGGGLVLSADGRIGCLPGWQGDVTVSGSGSTWANGSDLIVGYDGSGMLSIAAGGAVSNSNGYIARNASSEGMVTVADANSAWTNGGSLYVGGSDTAAGGTGQVSVADGGLLEVGGALKVWRDGTLDVAGGKVRIGGGAEPAAGQVRIGPDGTLALHGGEVTCAALDNSAGGTLDFPGGTLTVEGGAFEPPAGDFTLDGTGSPTLRLTGGAAMRLDGNDLFVGRTGLVAGLTYGILAGEFNEADENPGDQGVQLGPMASEITDLPEYTTHVYTGWFYDADGNVSFYENFDDSVKLVIDGNEVMRHVQGEPSWEEWQTPHSTGNLELGPDSWHTFELRLGQGGSASGPPDGMNLGFGFDNEPPICDANEETKYLHPVDPGDGSLFRVLPGHGKLEILAGATVSSAGGYLACEADSNGTVTIAGAGSAWTAAGSLYVGGSGTTAGGTARLTVADGGLLEVGGTLKLWPGGTLEANGGTILAETLDVTAGGAFNDTPSSTLRVNALAGFGDTISLNGHLAIGHGGGSGGAHAVGAGQSLTIGGSLQIAYDGNGTLDIAGGGAVSSMSGCIGYDAGSNGTVTVDGNGSTWTNYGILFVGSAGSGTLDIAGGGTVSNTFGYIGYDAGSDGTVTVDGSGSTWTNNGALFVGLGGNGVLNITGGGLVSCDGSYVGYYAASSTVRVDGNGSTWTNNSTLFVGLVGGGTLEITGGAHVSCDDSYVCSSPGFSGTVTVHGNGSTWTNSGDLYVGGGGNGTLRIAGGGLVSNSTGRIGYVPDSNGTVTVEGEGSAWTNDSELYVGYSGNGTLDITGGAVSNDHGYIGFAPGSNGTVTVDGNGSTWTNSGSLHVGGSETAAGGTGRLTVADGGQVEVGGVLKLWPHGTVEVSGGRVEVSGEMIVDGGTVEVSGGRLEVGGVLTLWPDGTVEVSGGTIRLPDPWSLDPRGGTFAFHFGTVEFDTDVEVTADTGLLTELFGSPITIPRAKELSITGQATLAAPVLLDGGTFSVGSLANAGLLEFQGGTFRLTDANLAVGPGGPFGARLALREDQRIEVVHDAEVLPGGELGLQGGVLAAGRLTNHGLITGRGRIEGPLTNGAGEVEVGPGERLRVTGPAVNDGGQMTLGGGTMHFEETLTNTGGGLVMGNGLLRADGGLTNEATMAFSGVANVVGDVENTPAGLILATGVGPTTFFDDVHNDGEIRVSAGSTAVYFGAADGDGNFTGTGMNYFEGDLKPGSSAGIMSFEGNVAFGAFASLQIELADPDNSDPLAPRYDALDVVGDVDLAGTLDLSWLPVAADPNSKFGGVYSILTYGGMRTGIFDGIDCQMAAYLDTSLFADGIEYDDANGEIKVHLYDLLVGDADLDGRVARGDFQALQDGFGSPDPDWFGGDFNFDGRVDFLDYLTWKANVGDSVPGAIPEPATVGLLALGALALVARMRRRS